MKPRYSRENCGEDESRDVSRARVGEVLWLVSQFRHWPMQMRQARKRRVRNRAQRAVTALGRHCRKREAVVMAGSALSLACYMFVQ